ncbi:hypothetical protein HPB47_001413 [Ixodes persulcatus]|uniref:Uncharacterized protein n=1 Tax=Ixodes persulcatus TaxID=34615 RepID=A0AC60PQK1_IXOPE|nr:hypothetical protein HPB47_001413 [Ixodes persulcatus]
MCERLLRGENDQALTLCRRWGSEVRAVAAFLAQPPNDSHSTRRESYPTAPDVSDREKSAGGGEGQAKRWGCERGALIYRASGHGRSGREDGGGDITSSRLLQNCRGVWGRRNGRAPLPVLIGLPRQNKASPMPGTPPHATLSGDSCGLATRFDLAAHK